MPNNFDLATDFQALLKDPQTNASHLGQLLSHPDITPQHISTIAKLPLSREIHSDYLSRALATAGTLSRQELLAQFAAFGRPLHHMQAILNHASDEEKNTFTALACRMQQCTDKQWTIVLDHAQPDQFAEVLGHRMTEFVHSDRRYEFVGRVLAHDGSVATLVAALPHGSDAQKEIAVGRIIAANDAAPADLIAAIPHASDAQCLAIEENVLARHKEATPDQLSDCLDSLPYATKREEFINAIIINEHSAGYVLYRALRQATASQTADILRHPNVKTMDALPLGRHWTELAAKQAVGIGDMEKLRKISDYVHIHGDDAMQTAIRPHLKEKPASPIPSAELQASYAERLSKALIVRT